MKKLKPRLFDDIFIEALWSCSPKKKSKHRHRYSIKQIDDYGETDMVCKCGEKEL